MLQSQYYNLNLVEGTDLVNPLVQDVPNYEKIDEVMKANETASIGQAVELVSQTVHAITRTWSNTPVFRFTATANFSAGETFTVDGVQVTALLPSGEPLGTGAYISGSEVLCALNSATNVMTVYTSGGTATISEDSNKLGGQLPSYYATKSEVDTAQSTATASGVLAQSVQTEVTELKAELGKYYSEEKAVGTWVDGKTIYRKCFSGVTSGSPNGMILGNIGASISDIIQIYGSIYDGDNIVPFNDYSSTEYYARAWYLANTSNMILNCGTHYGYANSKYSLVVEYTKQ